MAELILTEQNFETEVLKSGQPVLVDFWAQWCGPCRMLAPVMHEIAEEYAGRVRVGKVNVDEEVGLAIRFGIDSIPAVLLFQDGKLVKRSVGYRPKEVIEEMLR